MTESKTTRFDAQFSPHPELTALLKKSAERIKNMTPEELEAMEMAQRKSWTEQDHD